MQPQGAPVPQSSKGAQGNFRISCYPQGLAQIASNLPERHPNGTPMARTGRPITGDVVRFGAESRRLKCPDHLDPAAAAAFVDLIANTPSGQFLPSDLPLLSRYAETAAMAERAAAGLAATGLLTEDGRPHPLVAIHQALVKSLSLLSMRLRCCPQARIFKAPKVLPNTLSYYERVDLEQHGDDTRDRVDRIALRRAVDLARQDSKFSDLIDAKLKGGEAWHAVARFCASSCQSLALDLRPWMVPPVDISDIEAALARPTGGDIHQVHAAAKLLRRMLDVGLSRFDPDPIRSLEAAEAERTRATAVRQRTLSPLYPRKQTSGG